MNPEQIFALVAALLAGEPDASNFPVVAGGGADPRYPVAVAPCPRPVAPDEIEGETIICGTVTVPLNHFEPDGGQDVDLLFAIYRATSLVPAPDPVVHLHGGPGSGIMQSVGLTSFAFEELRRRRDIIAFDQRGVDTSGGIDRCFETVADNVEPILETLTGEESPALFTALVEACIAELDASGIEYQYINTEQNALDVAAVVSALGYEEYNLYGISYGTKLALETMRTAPEGLRSVIVDSVAPPSVNLYDTLLLPIWEAIENTEAQCNAQPACAEAYPDFADRYWALVETMLETPVQTDMGPISGFELFVITKDRNDWHGPYRGLTPWLPLMVSELEEGTTTTLTAILRGDLPTEENAQSIMAGATGLSVADTALARTALDAADQMTVLERMARNAIRALEADLAEGRAASGLAEEFDREMEAALAAMPDRAERVDFARDYLALRGAAPTPGALIVLVATHFDRTTQDRLLPMIRLMGPSDIADTFDRIGRDNVGIEQVLMGQFEQYLFACQEDMDWNSNEGTAAVHDQIDAAPTVEAAIADQNSNFFSNCALFEPHPREGFHDPVTADIPTLVMGGELDAQTASSWVELTASTLPNAQSVLFPETGHGALVFSRCAIDLGVAFIENPGAELDFSCAEDLRPSFVLPDGSWSHPE
ncbi:alpha/beta fold hydrolase [Rhodobacterales bacterium HKCCE3408]|nr:alpha/beta fold hydrolase [Rhodobacterales bacterium HKCCE3408]